MNIVKHWVAGGQIQGDRGYQEDDFSIRLLTDGDTPADEDRLLLVLADGMGGHAGGAVASKTVVEAFQDAFHHTPDGIAERFNAGVSTANDSVREKQQADPNLSEMGTTLVAAVVIGPALYWVSVGDSLLWVFRDGSLHRLNADHSMRPVLQDLVELGRMTEEEVLNDPRANQLRSAIFGDAVPLIDMNADGFGLESGDLVVLASDGLETLSEAALAEVIKAGADDAQGIVDALLDAVAKAGRPGQDNTTALVYRAGRGADSLHGTLSGAGVADTVTDPEQEKPPAGSNKSRTDRATAEPQGIITKLLRVLSGRRGTEDKP